MKNVDDMRVFVFNQITSLQAGKITPQNFKAIVVGLNLVVSTFKLELEYAKAMNKNPEMKFFDVGLSGEPEKQP